jgi:DNA replication protein DnaC
MSPDPISAELRQVLRTLRLSPMLDTLPERLTLARSNKMAHQDFLELVLSDEVSRRASVSATNRSKAARLDPAMTLETWDETAAVTYDRQLWSELFSLRFIEAGNHLLILGPVGVGKTHAATALGHVACRRRHSVVMARCDRLLKRLKASRLDGTYEAEMRRLIAVDLLVLDDFAIHRMDAAETGGRLRARGRAPPPPLHHRRVQPGAAGVAGDHGRSPPRSGGGGPPRQRRP